MTRIKRQIILLLYSLNILFSKNYPENLIFQILCSMQARWAALVRKLQNIQQFAASWPTVRLTVYFCIRRLRNIILTCYKTELQWHCRDWVGLAKHGSLDKSSNYCYRLILSVTSDETLSIFCTICLVMAPRIPSHSHVFMDKKIFAVFDEWHGHH